MPFSWNPTRLGWSVGQIRPIIRKQNATFSHHLRKSSQERKKKNIRELVKKRRGLDEMQERERNYCKY